MPQPTVHELLLSGVGCATISLAQLGCGVECRSRWFTRLLAPVGIEQLDRRCNNWYDLVYVGVVVVGFGTGRAAREV